MHMTDRSAERRLLVVRGRARAATEKQVSERVQAYLRGDSARSKPERQLSDALDPSVERRRCSRTAMAAEALVRKMGGFNFEVELNDISPNGCRVEMLEPCEIGDTAITRFPQLEPLGSRVCWVHGTTTGMEFSTDIHPAVFDMLLTRLSEEIATA